MKPRSRCDSLGAGQQQLSCLLARSNANGMGEETGKAKPRENF